MEAYIEDSSLRPAAAQVFRPLLSQSGVTLGSPAMNIPIPDCYWVVDRQFLAGEYPGASDAKHARDKLERFLDHGVTLFVDLTEEWELNGYADLARELGVTRDVNVAHERFPIQDMSIPTEHHLRAILSRIKAAVDAGETCYVHCWGGVGRTGTVVGCWLVQETGASAEEAIAQIAQWRCDTPDGWKRSPETDEQRAFIAMWARRRAE